MKYTDKQIDDLIEDIYKGRVTQTELPEDLYFAIADHLEKGLYKGFGGDLASFGGKDYELLNELRENVYMFSGAKTYQEVREMSSFLADSENFKEFKNKALEVYDTYNKNWLEAEYNTAIGQGMQAQQWNNIEKNKKDFPYLRYSAVIDARTSDICEPINGVTLPVDDRFWSEYTPLNHFNCRCTLEQIDKFEDVTLTSKEDIDTIVKGTDENKGLKDTVANAFKMNSGKDGYVFSPEHPYFEVAPKDKDLARENFNLPIPEAPAPKEIEFTPAKSIKEAEKFALENLNLNFVSYKGINVSLANDLNKGVLQTVTALPKVGLNGLGSAQEVQKLMREELSEAYKRSNWYQKLVEKYGPSEADKASIRYANREISRVEQGVLAWSQDKKTIKVFSEEIDFSKYRGVFLNSNISKDKELIDKVVKANTQKGWFSKGTEDFRHIVHHELGHEIDKTLNFNNNLEFRKIFDREHAKGIKHITENLSEYGATAGRIIKHRPHEMIAESWAEWTMNEHPRALAKEVSELMLKTYYDKFKAEIDMTLEEFIANTKKTFKK